LRTRRAFTLAALPQGTFRQFGKQLLMLALAIGFVLLFQERLRALDMAEILAMFHTLSLSQWAAALVATAVSFWAIGRYDGVLHRALGTGVGERSARRAGITAIALSQTIGFGLLTGTLIRWRLLPELSFWQAMRFSAIVALSFLLAWMGVTGIAHLLLPGSIPGAGLAGLAALAIGAAVLWISLKRPEKGIFGMRLPTLVTMRAMIALTALDTFAAAMVFHALLPASADIGFAEFFPAFLLAFGIGMISGTPGGMGPFEIALISLLPQAAPETLMAAAIGYRLIYFALPAILAMPILALGANARPWPDAKAIEMTPITPNAPLPAHVNRLIHNAPFAEAHFLRQGDTNAMPAWPWWHAGQASGSCHARARPGSIRALSGSTSPAGGSCGGSCARPGPDMSGSCPPRALSPWPIFPGSTAHGSFAREENGDFPWADSAPATSGASAYTWPIAKDACKVS